MTDKVDKQMHIWKTMMDNLAQKDPLPLSVLVQLESFLTSEEHIQHSINVFMEVFEAAKISTTDHSLIICSLVYPFRGDKTAISAEWIGIPTEDRIFYIGINGRVACTGQPPVQ